jgi:hypothetical protein
MELELEPGWKRALRTFFQVPYKPGDIVPKAWLEHELGIPYFDIGTKKQHDQANFAWWNEFSTFNDALLEDHQLWLERDRKTEGYRVLAGSEHFRFIQDACTEKIVRANRSKQKQLMNVQLDALTSRERTAHAEELARAAQLQAMLRPKQLGVSKPKKHSNRLSHNRKDTE